MCDKYFLFLSRPPSVWHLWQLASFSMEELSVAVYLNRVTGRLGHPFTVHSDIFQTQQYMTKEVIVHL